MLRQHLDRHPTLHENVLGQVDRAHAAGAQMVQQLVLSQEEAAMAAFQQLLGLPAGDQAGLDQTRGDDVGVGQRSRPVCCFQFRQHGDQLVFFHQPACDAASQEKCQRLIWSCLPSDSPDRSFGCCRTGTQATPLIRCPSSTRTAVLIYRSQPRSLHNSTE